MADLERCCRLDRNVVAGRNLLRAWPALQPYERRSHRNLEAFRPRDLIRLGVSKQHPTGLPTSSTSGGFVSAVVMRTMALALPAGVLLGALYGFCLLLLSNSVADAVDGMAIGGLFGGVGGLWVGLAAGFGIGNVPRPTEVSIGQVAAYLHAVRRVAGVWTLVAGLLPSLPFLPTAAISAVVYVVLPAAIAAVVAYALGPRAVGWSLKSEAQA